MIVTDNLFGDIITDLAAAIAGGIGLAASGNLDPSAHANPSMFEPVHGSAPDIAGQGKADPTAAVLSVSMLLDHLGETEPRRPGRGGGRRGPRRPRPARARQHRRDRRAARARPLATARHAPDPIAIPDPAAMWTRKVGTRTPAVAHSTTCQAE